MDFIKGLIVGIFAIFPGISGSAIAISLGIYDKLFISLKNIKDNIFFLILVFSGLIVGVIIGSNAIIYLSGFKNFLYYIFIGLIIGNIPYMVRKTNSRGRLRYIPLISSILFSMITIFFCRNTLNGDITIIKMVLGGILFSFGKIFPGVSSSFFLIILGIYKKIIICFSNPMILMTEFVFYLPFIIGCLIGILIFIKLLDYLLNNKYDILYSILIGFMLSSIISIFPKFNYCFQDIFGILLMVICSIISIKIHIKKEI